jgi:hypothetical protein
MKPEATYQEETKHLPDFNNTSMKLALPQKPSVFFGTWRRRGQVILGRPCSSSLTLNRRSRLFQEKKISGYA